jgi:hypothetical protein
MMQGTLLLPSLINAATTKTLAALRTFTGSDAGKIWKPFMAKRPARASCACVAHRATADVALLKLEVPIKGQIAALLGVRSLFPIESSKMLKAQNLPR